MRGRVTSALGALTATCSYPPALAHEATHYLAARPWARESALRADLTGLDAYVDVAWEADVPAWAVAFAFVAPTVLGFGLGAVVVAWWVLAGGDLPESVAGWSKLALAAIVWSVYTKPSPGDVAGAWREVRR